MMKIKSLTNKGCQTESDADADHADEDDDDSDGDANMGMMMRLVSPTRVAACNIKSHANADLGGKLSEMPEYTRSMNFC